MQPLLALLPLAVFVLLLAGLQQSAAMAGLLSAALSLALAVIAFGYPADPTSLLGPALEAAFTSTAILWIIFPALGIFEFQAHTGANERIGAWLASISSRPQITALLIAWFFALFLEGAAGFGTPVALAAPMLVALGFPPMRALLMALFGHAAGVSFGAVGTPIVPLLDAAAVDPRSLSLLILVPHAVMGGLLVLIVFRLARPLDTAGRASWLWVPAAAGLFFAPAAALAWSTGPELPTLGGALIGMLLFAVLAKRMRSDQHAGGARTSGSLLAAAMPYLLVLLLILLTRLVPPVAGLLRDAELTWRIGQNFGGSVSPLYHPGTILFVALVASALIAARGTDALRLSLRGAAARLPPVAFALFSVLLLARLMVHSGMIDVLARSATGLAGNNWTIAAPLVGVLGAFVTGSATASNIILADFQVAAAGTSNLEPLFALAGQGFGAAIGNIIAPHNIVAGAATVGLIGREGDVLTRSLPVCVLYALAGGAVLLVLSRTI